MLFLALLAFSSLAIAGAAEFFSVYGLANTFQGTFWSVVIMGSALGIGKLVAVSYLYRYWNRTNFILKTYLILGVVTLMFITSTGIFGYLSAGYQSSVVPLQQAQEQIALLQQQRNQAVARKQQIDEQIANLPRDYVRSRLALMRGFKSEENQVDTQIVTLDKQLLTLKQQQIETQAHTGPIIYIAEALGLSTNNATKYIIFLIMFAFDPMAVALTIALNNAIKIRAETIAAAKAETEVPSVRKPDFLQELMTTIDSEPEYTEPEPEPVSESIPEPTETQADTHVPETVQQTPAPPAPSEPPATEYTSSLPKTVEKFHTIDDEAREQPQSVRRFRPYTQVTDATSITDEKMRELLSYYRELKALPSLTLDQQWELDAITSVFKRAGYGSYVS
jgi:hypothetical protein